MRDLRKVLFTIVLGLLVLGAGVKARWDCWAGVEETAGMEGINDDQDWSGLNGDCVSWVQTEEGFGCNFFRGDMDYAAEYRVAGLSCDGACSSTCGNDWMGNGGPTNIETVEAWTLGDIADGNGTFFAHAMGVCRCVNIGGYELDAVAPRQRLDEQREPEIVYLARPGFPKSVRENGEIRPIFGSEDQITVVGKVRYAGGYVISGESVRLDLLVARAVLLPDAERVDVSRHDDRPDGYAVLNQRGMSRELLSVASSLLPQRVPRVYPGDRVIVR